MTYKDLEKLSVDQQLIYDKRTFCQYYYDFILNNHTFFQAFVLKTLMTPQIYRIMNFFNLLLITIIITTFFLCHATDSEENHVKIDINLEFLDWLPIRST